MLTAFAVAPTRIPKSASKTISPLVLILASVDSSDIDALVLTSFAVATARIPESASKA